MRFIADLHIHSHFSIATSKELRPEFLDYWARIKGIRVVGTGDFTHPGWIAELKEKLEPAGEGLFRVKKEFKKAVPFQTDDDVRFMLTAEISNVYKKAGKVRKVHNVVMAPSFEIAEKIQAKLSGLGFNITSDGRPILGLDSRDLLEICLEASEDIFFVPAHIWTPWFSALGSKSGFDSIRECYDDLAPHIFAVETGLSTDPAMNWLVSSLDQYTLLSNSDAHSPEKLGRNANIFNTELSYPAIIEAMKTGDRDKFSGTIDFFPEEGKYHYDGHRKCNVCWNPLETLEHDEVCPVCGKKVTEGVLNRVAQLADRDDIETRPDRHPFHSLIPLKELLSELEGVGPASKKITKQYDTLIRKAETEFNLLLNYDIEKVRQIAGNIISEAIERMRNREVFIKEGFDGEFGIIKVFGEGEKPQEAMQEALFMNEPGEQYHQTNKPRPLISFDIKKFQKLKKEKAALRKNSEPAVFDLFSAIPDITGNLNPEQKEAVNHYKGPALILAGPGTGKTKVLTTRIAKLIQDKKVRPENILAVTFTNKAATEMTERLSDLLKDNEVSVKVKAGTFHSFGLSVLENLFEKTGRKKDFIIIDEDDKKQIMRRIGVEKSEIQKVIKYISNHKRQISQDEDSRLQNLAGKYESFLSELNAFDFDDLIRWPLTIMNENEDILNDYREKIQWLLVDEYQDVNNLQYQLIRILMPDKNSNLFVIGDPNQAIYGFRGADIRFIESFKSDFPEAAIYNLKKSYRCSGSILQASGNIIDNQGGFLEGIRQGVKIKIAENPTDKSEAEFIARTVEEMIGGVGFFSMDSSITAGHKDKEINSFSDFAVLCRTGKQMKSIEKAFKDHNIPYQRVGEEPFFRQEPVKSVIDVLKIIHKGAGIFKERIEKERRIGETELMTMKDETENKSVSDKIKLITAKFFRKEKEESPLAFTALTELAGNYGNDTGKFLKEIALRNPIDTWKTGVEAVNLMTLHSSKGLEFNCVFIAGCEEGLIPYSLFEDKKADVDEEKRLLYVGMTRAKTHLFLTYAKKRFLMGKTLQSGRSHFLDSIEKELLEQTKQQYKKKVKKDDGQLNLF
jgi:uncharacterized protein (TIGR00375 family)